MKAPNPMIEATSPKAPLDLPIPPVTRHDHAFKTQLGAVLKAGHAA